MLQPLSKPTRLAAMAMVLLAVGSSRAEAQPPDIARLFQAANEHYARNNYPAAIEQYQKIVESGLASEVVFYNLANAYFRKGELGKAILWYEKAQRLAPSDREIAENLNFARTRIADKVERPPEGFFMSQLRRITTWMPLDVETGLVVLFFVAANAAFALFWLDVAPALTKLALYGSIACFGLFLVLGASNLWRIYWQETLQEAVILVEKADVLSGPGSDSPTLFSIHEGLKVRIENRIPDWVQISLENGWNGWVKSDAIGEI
jgi:tetratricopeptide (TPR) repeat protein